MWKQGPSSRTTRGIALLSVMLLLLIAAPANTQPLVTAVAPDSAQSGAQDLQVTVTLGGSRLPSDRVQPLSFRIGDIEGRDVRRDGGQVSALFDFSDGLGAGVQDVTLTFPTPRGELTLSLAQGFTIEDAQTPPPDDGPSGDNGLVYSGAESYAGYTLFAPMGQTTTYLIDHDGNVAHTWESSHDPNLSVYLLDDGSILRPASSAGLGLVERIDQDSNLVWSWSPSDPTLALHHDIEPLPNGNLLLIAYDVHSAEEAVAAGRNPELLSGDELWFECVLEVEPSGTTDGNLVWQWCAWDHLIQDYAPSGANYAVIADYPERIDLNYAQRGDADWLHANAVDYNADLDQVILSTHNLGEVWIIDHSTTTAEAAGHSGGNGGRGGDLLYRWGNPQVYGAGGSGDQTLFGQHDAQWIDDSLPGGGDILVFNNGQGRPGGNYSSVEQWSPPLYGFNYDLGTNSAWAPAAADWSYSTATPGDFYADHISGAQRLPNGNTLICDGTAGEFFEITAAGDIVWDYLNPYSADTPRGEMFEVFQATRIAPDAASIVALGL